MKNVSWEVQNDKNVLNYVLDEKCFHGWGRETERRKVSNFFVESEISSNFGCLQFFYGVSYKLCNEWLKVLTSLLPLHVLSQNFWIKNKVHSSALHKSSILTTYRSTRRYRANGWSLLRGFWCLRFVWKFNLMRDTLREFGIVSWVAIFGNLYLKLQINFPLKKILLDNLQKNLF